MNILVCIKQVPDTPEVKLREDFTLERDFAARIMNPADESALEWALQVRDRTEGSVTVLSMGPGCAESTLREAISRGADEAVLLSDPRFAGADTLITAQCLAEAAKALGGFDLIACGRRAADGETGQVGPMTASMLNIPCVSNVIRAEAGEGLTVWQLTESEVKVWRCAYPALLTFCEWSCRLRLPGLAGLRKAGKVRIRVMTPDDLGLSATECGIKASPTRVIRVSAEEWGARPCRKGTAEEIMNAMTAKLPEVFS